MKRFTTSDGLSLAFHDDGEGQPVLCLPGLTRDARDFEDLAAALGPGQRLIRLSPRGRGDSDRDPDFRNYAVPIEARDAVELLDHLGVAQAVIVGTSRGGLLAMVMAATVRDRLAGVVLNDIGPEIDPRGLEKIMTYLGIAPSVRTFEAAAAALKARLGRDFPTVDHARWLVLANRWFAAGDGRLELTYDPALRDSVEQGSAEAAPDMWPLFDSLTGLPTAVIRGANSDILSAETFARMRARRPDLIASEVPDRGHVPFLDEPEAVQAVRAVLDRATA